VAPIIEMGARARDVYLPAGEDWRDAWTDTRYTGGQTIQADAPLERIPVFIREGSQVRLVAPPPMT